MAAITLSQAQTKLTEYLDAEAKALNGQTVTIEGRTLTRANLSEIRRGRKEWQQTVDQLQAAADKQNRRVAFASWTGA